jgi:ribosome-associated protein
MIEFSQSRFINDSDLSFEYIKSSGPGGQNINKTSTAVRLRFNLMATTSLDPEEKIRLIKIAGKRFIEDGYLVIFARRFRSQEQNRVDAIRRLITLMNSAIVEPKTRIITKPSSTARLKRSLEKKKMGALKKNRHFNPEEWEE